VSSYIGLVVVFDTHYPHPLFLEAFDALRQIGDYRNLQMFDGTRRRVDHRGGDFGGSATRDNHAMYANRFSGTQQRTEVLGVLQVVKQQQKGHFVA
jgi:hypothetical protein